MSSLEETITHKRNYQLDLEPLYADQSGHVLRVLESTPAGSNVKVVESSNTTGSGQITFDFVVGETNFLSSDIRLDFHIPFQVKLLTAETNPITKDNFMEVVFNNNSGIAFSQLGMLNGLESLSVNLNSNTLQNVNNIPNLTALTCPYWNIADNASVMQASVVDRFSDIENYTTALKSIKFIDSYGAESETTLSPINDVSGIFSSCYDNRYNTRTPSWTFISSPDLDTVNVYAHFWVYLPFSIGTTPANAVSYAGIERAIISATLKNDLATHVFNMNAAALAKIDSITQLIGSAPSPRFTLTCKVYSPPSYVRSGMRDEKGVLKAYSMSFPQPTYSEYQTLTVPAKGTENFSKFGISLGSIPSRAYIALIKDRDSLNTEGRYKCLTNYGLITSLTVSIGPHKTVIQDQKALQALVDSNNYSELDHLARQFKGYPIKLDFGKDLNLGDGRVVGEVTTDTMDITGTFVNQSGAFTTYKFAVAIVRDNVLEFENQRFLISSGVSVPSEVLSSQFFLPSLYEEHMSQIQVVGAGRFGDAMRWLGRNALKVAKSAWANRDKIASTVGDIAGLIKTIKGGGMVLHSNVSGGSSTRTLGAGDVRSKVFK